MNIMKQKLYKFIGVFLAGVLLTGIFWMPYSTKADEQIDLSTQGGKYNAPVSVDPIDQEEGFSAVLYNNRNGLPTSEANDIVQTEEGFIWIGTYGGLIRYDGSRFERISPEIGINSVKCLHVDHKGRLWIGTNDGGVVLKDKNDYLRWDASDGLKSLSVRAILEDKNGEIYIGTTEGLLVINEQMKISYVEDLRLVDNFLHDLRLGPDGKIYAVCNSGDVAVLKDRKVVKYYRFQGGEGKGVNCLLPDPNDPDLVYAETRDGGVYHDTLDSGFMESEAIDISPLSQVQQFECFDGEIWICARNGIGVLNDTGFHLLKNVSLNNSIGHVMTDYEGNLWFTSTREGVMKIVKNRFVDLFERSDLVKTVVNSTCIYDGNLFIATDRGLRVIDEDGTVPTIPLDEEYPLYNADYTTNDLLTLLDNCRIRSLTRDSKDRLWIATWLQYGLLRFDHGELKSFTEDDGLYSNYIRAVYECKDGRMLVAMNGGVCVIKDDKVVAKYNEKHGIVNTDVLTVCEGENGDIMLGTDGAGIYIIHGNEISHIGFEEGLTSENVMRIKHDEKRGIYWIVTGNSLSYLNKDYELTNVDQFPYFNNFDLYENSKGELWVLSSNGIYIANVDDVLNGGPIETVHYSISNGLPCIATANSYSELTDDGILYISGRTGVAKVNTEAPFEDVADIKFGVPYIETDGTRVYPDEKGVFHVPYSTKKVTIYGYVYAYSLIDPTVSYHLEGFEEGTTSGKATELFPVNYTNLRGGTYKFVMELRYSMNDKSVGESVQIVKEKAYYEQAWFYVYAIADALIAGFALVRIYVDRMEDRLEKKHKEESEKQRMANELSMGNNIQRAMLPHIFPPFPDRKEFEIYASMDPAKEVGGDFYDYFFIDDDHLAFLMADVSGKGIPGALFMMVTKTILHNSAMYDMSPANTLTMANDAICEDNQAQMFVTAWLGVLEISTGKLKAANAGHEYPIIKEPDGNFEILKDKHGLVLGAMKGVPYHEYELQIEPGSTIFLYTDGIPEATNANNKMFGMERLLMALNKAKDKRPEEVLIQVRKDVDKFVGGAEQFDDLTMLCLKYTGTKE